MSFLPQSLLLSLTCLFSTAKIFLKNLCFLTYLVFLSLTHYWREDSFSKIMVVSLLTKIYFLKKVQYCSCLDVFYQLLCGGSHNWKFHLMAHVTQFKIPFTGTQGRIVLHNISGLWCFTNGIWYKVNNIVFACLLEHNVQQNTMQHVSAFVCWWQWPLGPNSSMPQNNRFLSLWCF